MGQIDGSTGIHTVQFPVFGGGASLRLAKNRIKQSDGLESGLIADLLDIQIGSLQKQGAGTGKALLLAAKAPFCYLPQIVLGTGYVGKDLLFQLLLRSKFLFGA